MSTEVINNITNPGQDPVNGDLIERVGNTYSIREQFNAPTTESIAEEARMWRDMELTRTDTLHVLDDYPNAANLTTYRAALRAWPSTSDFPDTKPTLGS